MTAKQALMELATALPDDVEWEEAEYQIWEAEEIGAVYTVDEARAAVKQWNTR